MGPNALGTVENDSKGAKHEIGTRRARSRRKRVRRRKTLKWDPTPSVPLKTSMGEKDMKMRPDALGIAENESWSTKHENRTRRAQF
jgi:hypothetical protein